MRDAWNYPDRDSGVSFIGRASTMAVQQELGLLSNRWRGVDPRNRHCSSATWLDLIAWLLFCRVL